MDNIKTGIANFELSKNRMEIYQSNGITIINDCYNANFDSMKAALESLARMKGKRKIAILGDMLELGAYSKELHHQVGVEVVKNKINLLITVGKEAEIIANSAVNNGMNLDSVYQFKNNEEAISFIKRIIAQEDVMLIKASNGMKFIEIVNALKNDSIKLRYELTVMLIHDILPMLKMIWMTYLD